MILTENKLLTLLEIQQLAQLATATWAGDLISKQATYSLMDRNLVYRADSWYMVTELGLTKLIDSHILFRN